MSKICDTKHNCKNVSISMYIDKSNISRSKTLPLKRLLENEHRIVYKWIPDSSVSACYKCKSDFTLINRKHHCRNCGKIFCSKCSNNWAEIPNFINNVSKENIYWSLNTYINYLNINNSKERTCEICFLKIIELKHLLSTMEIFNLLSLNISDYLKINSVCKSWNKIANYYFASLREMQYYLPDYNYSKKEINILINNKNYFTGHSKWLTQLIMINEIGNIDTNEILDIIEKKKK